MALSSKHRQFVNEYVSCWNATEAYRRVYPKTSDEAAKANSARLIANDNVAEEIQRRLAEKTMTADEALVRLAEQARAEYAAYLLADGSVDLGAMKADGKMHLIKSIKPTRYGKAVEFHDAQTALVNIGRHHGLFTDKTEINGQLEHHHDGEAVERILGRMDSLSARLGTKSPDLGDSADQRGSGAA